MKKENLYQTEVKTDLGPVILIFSDAPFVLTAILLPGTAPPGLPYPKYRPGGPGSTELKEMTNLVQDAIEGRPRRIPWPYLRFDGLSRLQTDVLRKVAEIPYGSVATYKDIAVAIGRPRAYRFVGSAVAKNPYPILIPCHRVIRSDRTPGGFGGGTALKKKMIEYEQALSALRNRTGCDTG